MSAQDHFDVIIIGTGAGGGTLAHKLAPTGKKILLLERGGYVPRRERQLESARRQRRRKISTKEIWHDRDGNDLHPHTNYNVGGNTKFYGAALFRLRREDFGELRHHGGLSPAWPIRYPTWSPITPRPSGCITSTASGGDDPTEPPRAHLSVPRDQLMSRESSSSPMTSRAGSDPFHVPIGVTLNEKDSRGKPCIRCNIATVSPVW